MQGIDAVVRFCTHRVVKLFVRCGFGSEADVIGRGGRSKPKSPSSGSIEAMVTEILCVGTHEYHGCERATGPSTPELFAWASVDDSTQ